MACSIHHTSVLLRLVSATFSPFEKKYRQHTSVGSRYTVRVFKTVM